jgi:predicted transport protein
MKAQHVFFPKIMNGASQFVIPVFQRDYSWTEENCRQLWKDILLIAVAPGERGHFIGSVVYIQSGDSNAGFSRWLLIDGQQRMTTLTLLMAALRDHIIETKWVGSEDGPVAKKIDAYFLRNALEEGEKEFKLQLRRHDNETLQAIIAGALLPDDPSANLRDNYELFRDLLQEVEPEQVYAGINRLMLVDVTLERGMDDPQLIFESLNSTGVSLSASDLIRNFILMSLTEKAQTRLYRDYWGKIEDLFRGSDRVFSNFIRDYLALRSQPAKLERSDLVYAAFRRAFGGIGHDPEALEALLADLMRRAGQYASFAVGTGTDERARAFAQLRHLADVPAILIMRLLEAREVHGSLSEPDLLEAVRLIESYLLRRAVIGAQSRGYGLEFAKLAYRIDDAQPLASLKAAFARMPAAYAFPDNEEFKRSLLEGDLYHKRVCKHVLDGLENRDSKEQSDTSAYSIEHIMPQNEKMPEAWRVMLGEDWKGVRQTWLHRLGNLTLTGYNSTYSDRPLTEKQTIEHGFRQSSVRLNQDVRDAAVWTEAEMSARGARLAARALSVWPRLDADSKMILEMEREELKARAASRRFEKVAMTGEAKALFDALRDRIKVAFPDVIEMAEAKSVSYHDPDFFLEVIPRKRGLGLLIGVDYNEVDGPDETVRDTATYSFVMHASYQGGVLINLRELDQLEQAMRVISQAHTLISGAG